MPEHCIHETDIFEMRKDLYNDGHGIKAKVTTLWEQYYMTKGRRDMLLIANSLILTVCSVLMVVITYKIL